MVVSADSGSPELVNVTDSVVDGDRIPDQGGFIGFNFDWLWLRSVPFFFSWCSVWDV